MKVTLPHPRIRNAVADFVFLMSVTLVVAAVFSSHVALLIIGSSISIGSLIIDVGDRVLKAIEDLKASATMKKPVESFVADM